MLDTIKEEQRVEQDRDGGGGKDEVMAGNLDEGIFCESQKDPVEVYKSWKGRYGNIVLQ